MPTLIVFPTALVSNTGFSASSGNFINDIQHPLSADHISNPAEPFPQVDFITYSIPALADIGVVSQTRVVANVRVDTDSTTPPNYVEIAVHYPLHPTHDYNHTFNPAGAYAMLTAIDPHPEPFSQYAGAEITLEARMNNSPALGPGISCNYFAFEIDFTPYSVPAEYVMVWTSIWRPPPCSLPPPKSFRPFKIIPTSDLSPKNISDEYGKLYGKPPAGMNLWLICRSLSADLQPNFNSPIMFLTWPANPEDTYPH